MKQQIYYLNDRTKDAYVYIGSLSPDPIILSPAEGRFFEIDVPEDHYLFIKVWETGVVLLSTGEKSALPQEIKDGT